MTEWLPLAIAIAASPFPVIPAILLLFTARPRATSWSFLAGWVTGVLVVTAVAVALSDVIETSDEPAAWASWTRLVLGLALVGYGIRQWATRAARTESPAWMRALSTAGPAAAFRAALLLSAANPKVLLLAVAGGLVIGTGSASAGSEMLAVLGFTLVASVSVALPVVLYAVRGERVLQPLGTVRDWLERNNAAVMAVVMVVIGIALVTRGVQGI